MPATIADYMKEVGWVFPQIAPNEREFLTWQAVKEICDENDLSFMIGEAKIVSEAQYKTGTIAVTSGATGVTLSSGTWDASWTDRKIRIQGRREIYGITIDSSSTGTLDANFEGDTSSSLTYVIFRDTYDGPSDCNYSKELMLWDTLNNAPINFVDFSFFQHERRYAEGNTGTPECVTRGELDSSGVPQLIFGPYAPASKIVYMMDYYRSPVKPANLSTAISPVWPEAFEKVIPQRVIWKYAAAKGHSRRFEFEKVYRDTIWNMNAKFNGGNEMRRRMMPRRRNTDFHVRVRYSG